MSFITEFYKDFYNEGGILFFKILEKMVQDWPLVKDPLTCVYLSIFYLSGAYFGPYIMKNFKPFNLKYFMMIYNIFNIIASTYISLRVFFNVKKDNKSIVFM